MSLNLLLPGRTQPHLDQLFDELVVLLDQVIEVFDWSKLVPLGQLVISLYLVHSLGIS